MVTVVYVSDLPDDIALVLKLKEVSDRTLGVTFMKKEKAASGSNPNIYLLTLAF